MISGMFGMFFLGALHRLAFAIAVVVVAGLVVAATLLRGPAEAEVAPVHALDGRRDEIALDEAA